MRAATIIIGSRKSDLAKIQAFSVGEEILKTHPNTEIKYEFSSSFGDKNQDIELDSAVDKGLFTADLRVALKNQDVDLVVHSWKDLPIEESDETEIVATLPRADMRDLLLIKKKKIDLCKKSGNFCLMTSSPRRDYHFRQCAFQLLPWKINSIETSAVRGNLLTRIEKFFKDEDADGLILAKAAVDRILQSDYFVPTANRLKSFLELCEMVVLPLKWFPSAAAQGALAIEARKDDKKLKKILKQINCEETFLSAQKERETLKSFGGGCHQKIGVSFLRRPYGSLKILKGKSEVGVLLDAMEFLPNRKMPAPKRKQDCWPLYKETLFVRQSRELSFLERQRVAESFVFLARESAWPKNTPPPHFLWVSGLKSWSALVKRGVFVNGSAESLGEEEDRRLDFILGSSKSWLRLTHDQSFEGEGESSMATYRLMPAPEPSESLAAKTHFYWMSASQFYRAREICPQIVSGIHSCGPGRTLRELEKIIDERCLFVWDSYSSWLKSLEKL